MSSLLTLPDMYRACGYPQATPAEISTWNALETGPSASGTIKLGLFGYDISCLESMCASIDNLDLYFKAAYLTNPEIAKPVGYCGLIGARGLDGLAFGAYFKLASDNISWYCIGFRNDTGTDRIGNTRVCV